VHNSIPEYASTTSISTVMTIPFHVKPFEKKVFEEVICLLKYHQNPHVPKRRSIEKKERKSIERKREKKEKERKRKKRKKKKSSKSLQIKGKSIFGEEKNTSTSKIFF
jgi:hypothetical protein